MDQLKPLGKRDIFGIVLPGTIVVFASVYTIFGVLVLLGLKSWVTNLLGQEFLLSLVLFVVAYLVGSLLRLVAADDVDDESSKYLQEDWQKKYQEKSDYEEKYKAKLAKGDDVVDIPDEDEEKFDKWLWGQEKFPYPAWQNRKWQAHGPCEVLEFFCDKYKSSMWPERWSQDREPPSPKTFFNYCKLVVISGGGGLADEVNMAEGLTRFFAGTVIALRRSTWLLYAALVTQLAIVAASIVAQELEQKLYFSPGPEGWTFHGFYFVLTLALIFALRWISHQIVSSFRKVRLKEAETVYHAFYLSVLHSDKAARRDQTVLRET